MTPASCLLLLLLTRAIPAAASAPASAVTSPPTPPANTAPGPPPAVVLDAAKGERIFNEALADYHRDSFEAAAAGFFRYLQGSAATAESYGWAQFFLGESLAALGYWHAASVYYYLVAKTRSQPETLNEALSRLEAMTRRQPFDEYLIYEDLLYDAEFGALPTNLTAWINYVQGMLDYKKGFIDWGEKHFRNIDRASPYLLEANYVRGVYAVRERREDIATDDFATIADANGAFPPIRNKARLALARLLFDRGYYADAIGVYDKVNQIALSYEQAQILTEKAWAAYYTKDYAKALGLLHGLEAPSYATYFLPDEYLLRGLIFKDLCHYLAAKNVVRAFRFRYGRALDALKDRQPMERIARIRGAALAQGSINRRSRLLTAMRRELDRLGDVDSAWHDTGLFASLTTLYEKGIADHAHRWRDEFKRAADDVALHLLETAEQINLLDYEVSMDIYKPLDTRDAKVSENVRPLPSATANVLYEFDGEFWNDELRDYQYFINSRCFGRKE